MDNPKARLNDVFYYGFYMDEEIFKNKQVIPRNQRFAFVRNYELKLGEMATLLRKDNTKAYGVVYTLSHDEIDILYTRLSGYMVEVFCVELQDGSMVPTLSYYLREAPMESENNDAYYQKLTKVMKRYNLPIP